MQNSLTRTLIGMNRLLQKSHYRALPEVKALINGIDATDIRSSVKHAFDYNLSVSAEKQSIRFNPLKFTRMNLLYIRNNGLVNLHIHNPNWVPSEFLKHNLQDYPHSHPVDQFFKYLKGGVRHIYHKEVSATHTGSGITAHTAVPYQPTSVGKVLPAYRQKYAAWLKAKGSIVGTPDNPVLLPAKAIHSVEKLSRISGKNQEVGLSLSFEPYYQRYPSIRYYPNTSLVDVQKAVNNKAHYSQGLLETIRDSVLKLI